MDLKKFCISIFFSPVIFISQNHILAFAVSHPEDITEDIYLFVSNCRYAYLEFFEEEAVQNAVLLSESELHDR